MDGGGHLTVLLVVVFLRSFCLADFVVTPSSQTIEIENGVEHEVLFRCRHENVDAVISWRISGSSSRQYRDVTDGFLRKPNGTRVDTLSIPAIPRYNGSSVVCRAQVDGSPDQERTPAATLIIIVSITTSTMLMYSTSNATQASTPTTTAPPPTTTKATPAPTTTANFEITPAPLTVAVEQGTATFHCQHSSCDDINWRVNGTSLNRLGSLNITSTITGIGTKIDFLTLLEFHQTTVVCVAFFDTSPPQFTSPVTLLIQDTPGPVKSASCTRNYSSNTLITFWDSLPSLDINDTDPDIVYGVELYKISCGQDSFVNYKVANKNHTSNTIDPYQIYKAVISPRNNVLGARNGTSVIMEEKFMPVRHILFRLTRNSHVIVEDETPVPSYYTVTLKSLDGYQQGDLNSTIIATREGKSVTLKMERHIKRQRLWNVSIHAYNCTTDSMEEGIELSTHDIQNVSVISTHPGQIRVTGDITDGSTVTGGLVIVYSHSDVRYIIASSLANQGQNIDVTVDSLTDTNYGVSTFSMENGVPFSRVVAVPRIVDVDNANEQKKQASVVEYTLQQKTHGVCINCTFLDSSATDCVAMVHQRISQLNSSGLMNIESSHKFTRSGDTASGCIEGVNLKDYQVGIIGGRKIHPNVATTNEGGAAVCSGCIAGAVLGVVFFVTSTVIVAALILVIHRRRIKLPSQKQPESGLLSPAAPTVNTPTVCHEYEECPPPNLRNQRDLTNVQGSSNSSASSDLDNPPPLPTRLEEPSTPTDQTPLEPNTMSTNSPATTETDILSSDSSTAGANDDDPGDPTYDQPVFPKTSKSTSTNMHPGLCADHSMSGGEASDETRAQSADCLTYVQPQLTTSSTVQCPPAADNVVYNQVKGFQNSQCQQYVMLSDMPTSVMTPDGHQKTEYAVIRQRPSKPTSDEGVNPNVEVDPNECSKQKISEEKLTEDQAFHTLLCYSSQWQSLGEALSLDEDHLDEIFTNNEMDEACLQEVLRLYFKRSDLEHSWQEIDAALKRIGAWDKQCTTTSDMQLQPQPSDDVCQEKTEDEPLNQTETSGGGPVLRPFLTNKSGTFVQSEESLLEGDTHDDLPMFQEIDFVSPVEESVLLSHFDTQDKNGKQQMQENQQFNNSTHLIQDKQHVELYDLESTCSCSHPHNNRHSLCFTSDVTPPRATHLIQDDTDRTGDDDFLDRQQLSQNDCSPQAFAFSQEDVSNNALTVIPKTEICQESNKDETDYSAAMIRQFNIGCENKSQVIQMHRCVKSSYEKHSRASSSQQANEETALKMSGRQVVCDKCTDRHNNEGAMSTHKIFIITSIQTRITVRYTSSMKNSHIFAEDCEICIKLSFSHVFLPIANYLTYSYLHMCFHSQPLPCHSSKS